MKEEITEHQLLSILNKITKLSTLEFFGVAKFFNVPLMDADGTSMRQTEDVLSDIIDTIIGLNQKQLKNFDKLLKKVIKQR